MNTIEHNRINIEVGGSNTETYCCKDWAGAVRALRRARGLVSIVQNNHEVFVGSAEQALRLAEQERSAINRVL